MMRDGEKYLELVELLENMNSTDINDPDDDVMYSFDGAPWSNGKTMLCCDSMGNTYW